MTSTTTKGTRLSVKYPQNGMPVMMLADDERGLKKGQQGQILAIRWGRPQQHVDPNETANTQQWLYLVKWKGKSGPVAVWEEQITRP